jgi:hypothetical protein
VASILGLTISFSDRGQISDGMEGWGWASEQSQEIPPSRHSHLFPHYNILGDIVTPELS